MGLFSKPKAPKPQPVAPLPDDNDPAVLRAKRMSILSAQGRSGRDSTILNRPGAGDALGDTPGGLK
ncbi:hypothetical protein [Labrys wisconsinensis]|uniref:Uncharacterized protein n=1 Tax=Labrys wisconsinensis TaxID=425677 RepID=A0ABU0JL72_9HYPH|nr:hypothetical protein [Labrys wisconsinensis]MDQ0475046.1 hypothetical protein [Labrys wisconsinensis]